MNVQYSFRQETAGPNLQGFATRCLQYGLGRFARDIREISVVFEDCNGEKGGIDKRCRAEVQLVRGRRLRAVVIDSTCESAVHRATSRLRRQLQNAVGERNQNHDRVGLRAKHAQLSR